MGRYLQICFSYARNLWRKTSSLSRYDRLLHFINELSFYQDCVNMDILSIKKPSISNDIRKDSYHTLHLPLIYQILGKSSLMKSEVVVKAIRSYLHDKYSFPDYRCVFPHIPRGPLFLQNHSYLNQNLKNKKVYFLSAHFLHFLDDLEVPTDMI